MWLCPVAFLLVRSPVTFFMVAQPAQFLTAASGVRGAPVLSGHRSRSPSSQMVAHNQLEDCSAPVALPGLPSLLLDSAIMTVLRDSAPGATLAPASVSDGASPSEEVTPSGPAAGRAATGSAPSPLMPRLILTRRRWLRQNLLLILFFLRNRKQNWWHRSLHHRLHPPPRGQTSYPSWIVRRLPSAQHFRVCPQRTFCVWPGGCQSAIAARLSWYDGCTRHPCCASDSVCPCGASGKGATGQE